jgi:hypothetical protein
MDARPILDQIAQALEKHALQAVLIGNAAAALQGAPVTTVDFDFFFRRTPANLKKLKRIAADLGAIALHPYYPASGLIRLIRDDDGLQLDFMDVIDGVKSFEGLRRRSLKIPMGRASLSVAPWNRKTGLAAQPIESPSAARDRIVLSPPHENRTHFLRKRIGWRMSAL